MKLEELLNIHPKDITPWQLLSLWGDRNILIQYEEKWKKEIQETIKSRQLIHE